MDFIANLLDTVFAGLIYFYFSSYPSHSRNRSAMAEGHTQGHSQSDNNKRQRQLSGVGGGDVGREMVINELLCFTQRKLRQLPEKTLKQLLIEFYDTERVIDAKDQLADSMTGLNLLNWSRPRRRNNSKEHPGAKLRGDIEDILAMLTFCEENLLTSRLPIYVAADPDAMPSAKLTEGDLQCLLFKLSALNDKVDTIGEAVAKSDGAITGLAAAISTAPTVPVFDAPPMPRPLVALRQPGVTAPPISRHTSSSCENINPDDQNLQSDDWFSDPNVHVVHRNKSNRMINASNTGTSYSNALVAGRQALGVAAQPSANRPNQQRVSMLGASLSTSFKASKTLQIRKAVFKVSNVDAVYSADNLIDHLTNIGVRLADDPRTNGKSCFELKPGPRQPPDNKCFRICIFAADKSKLLVKDSWASGIWIQEWIFHPRNPSTPNHTVNENLVPPSTNLGGEAVDVGVVMADVGPNQSS